MSTAFAFQALPPVPASELERVEHQRLRRRLLYGWAQPDVRQRLLDLFGAERTDLFRAVDQTSNPYRLVWSQLSTLYSTAPTVEGPTGTEEVVGLVEDSGWWALASLVQRDTLALRTVFVRVALVEGELVFRPVPPDLVEVEVEAARPSVPVTIKEWAVDPLIPGRWVQHVYSAKRKSYTVLRDSVDVTEEILGQRFEGETYPWVDSSGKPYLPWVVYRAAEGPYLFGDALADREVVEGTLNLGAYYTFFGHALRNAAWSQRYIVNARPLGSSMEDGEDSGQPRQRVVTDPATAVQLESSGEGNTQPQVGQWAAPTDPEKMLNSVMTYERRLVDAALGEAMVSRNSADIRSGYSLAVSREAQREKQRSYEPLFRRADRQLLVLAARLLGLETTPRDWRVTYHAIPRDPSEIAAELEQLKTKVELGLISRLDAYLALHPGLSREEGRALLGALDAENQSLKPTLVTV